MDKLALAVIDAESPAVVGLDVAEAGAPPTVAEGARTRPTTARRRKHTIQLQQALERQKLIKLQVDTEHTYVQIHKDRLHCRLLELDILARERELSVEHVDLNAIDMSTIVQGDLSEEEIDVDLWSCYYYSSMLFLWIKITSR